MGLGWVGWVIGSWWRRHAWRAAISGKTDLRFARTNDRSFTSATVPRSHPTTLSTAPPAICALKSAVGKAAEGAGINVVGSHWEEGGRKCRYIRMDCHASWEEGTSL